MIRFKREEIEQMLEERKPEHQSDHLSAHQKGHRPRHGGHGPVHPVQYMPGSQVPAHRHRRICLRASLLVIFYATARARFQCRP